jgi:hypothetical protein
VTNASTPAADMAATLALLTAAELEQRIRDVADQLHALARRREALTAEIDKLDEDIASAEREALLTGESVGRLYPSRKTRQECQRDREVVEQSIRNLNSVPAAIADERRRRDQAVQGRARAILQEQDKLGKDAAFWDAMKVMSRYLVILGREQGLGPGAVRHDGVLSSLRTVNTDLGREAQKLYDAEREVAIKQATADIEDGRNRQRAAAAKKEPK